MSTKTKDMSGTEAWVHNEYRIGRDYDREDFEVSAHYIIGNMAKTAYVMEMARLLDVNIELKK